MKLLLIFSPGMSIKSWSESGYLPRELKIYGELAKRIGEVWWYTYGSEDVKYEGLLDEHGIRLFPIDTDALAGARNPYAYDKIILRKYSRVLNQFDVVKTNQFPSWHMAAHIKEKLAIPFVLRQGYWHPLKYRIISKRPWSGIWSKLIEYRAGKLADAIVVTSQEAARMIEKARIAPKDRIFFLPNAIDVDLFSPRHDEIEEMRDVLWVGRSTFEKDPKCLMNALKTIKHKKISATFIGRGGYLDGVHRFINTSGEKFVHMDVVAYDQLPTFYRSHKVYVIPSRWEGNPKTLLEAMACGGCVIGRDVFGIREVITDGQDGLLFRGGAKSLARCMERALEDRELRRKLGENARETILNGYALPKLIEREADLLRKVVYGSI